MKKRLRVMWIGLRGFPHVQGGVEKHAEHICPLLAEQGCDVTVLARSGYQPVEVGTTWRGVKFKTLWAPRSKRLEAIVHTLFGVLYAAVKRPDILHIQAIGPALMVPLARLLGLKVVATHHGPDYERQKWGGFAKAMLKLGEFFGMRCAHDRIAISQGIRQMVQRKHGVDCVLIPNGVEMPILKNNADIVQKFGLTPKKYVLLVSRFVPEKRHHDLIDAFRQARLTDWKLVLVGAADHPDAYTQSVLDAAETDANIVCTGFQTGAELKALYEHAGIFVLPSSHEGLPIALLEAMSFGLPSIASDIAPHLEIDCSDIDYYPLGDVPALCALLQRQALAPQEDNRRERLRQFVAERYQWRDVALRTYDLYIALMAGKESMPVKPEPLAKTI